jgi:hypothetical protein
LNSFRANVQLGYPASIEAEVCVECTAFAGAPKQSGQTQNAIGY